MDIFLSYKNDDIGDSFAARLKQSLNEVGFSVYYNEDEHRSGSFPNRLREEIKNCNDFILLLSKKCVEQLEKSEAKDWVSKELLCAQEHGKNIVPVLIGKTEMPSKNLLPDKIKFLADLDACTLLNRYTVSPFAALLELIKGKPSKNNPYKTVFSSSRYYGDDDEDYDISLKKANNSDELCEYLNKKFDDFFETLSTENSDLDILSDIGSCKTTKTFDIEQGILKRYCGTDSDVIIPDGVVEIADEAFASQSKLISIAMPESLREIGKRAFKNCTRLLAIAMPDTVTKIDSEAFEGCCSLVSCRLSNKVTKIEGYTFKDCKKLSSIVIPNGITEIGVKAFRNCTSLSSIILPDSVTKIDWEAFSFCENLTSVTIPKHIKILEQGVFGGCLCLNSVVIPEGVIKIGQHAFKLCQGIVSITIPSNVIEIGDEAFCDCSGLKTITMFDGLIKIGTKAFSDCTSLQSVILPESVKEIGRRAFSGCEKLHFVKLPNELQIMEYSAFSRCRSLTSITIPDRITRIEGNVFAFCECLNSITLPDTLRIIGEDAFELCSGLTSICIPNGVIEIGEGAFGLCKSLTSIVIPESVERIRKGAFNNCPNLYLVIVKNNASIIEKGAFELSHNVTIVCQENSYANEYCKENNILFIYDYQYEAFHGAIPPGIEKLASPFLADEEKPFIFISYSHKDRDLILEPLKSLYESGWKIWYDEGLTIGDKYDETLEEHVKSSSAFLIFISENSRNSTYITENEIPWAVKYDKPIIKCILDEKYDFEINGENRITTVLPNDIEFVLERIEGLLKGSPREAKGISVIFNPSNRKETSNGFAYSLYSEKSAAKAKTILLEAINNGCFIYDAIKNGEDKEKLKNSKSLIVFLDKNFLSNKELMRIFTNVFESGRDIAVCQLDDINERDLPENLKDIFWLHWLVFNNDTLIDNKKQLPRYLQKRGCVNTAILPGFDYKITEAGIEITRYTGMNSKPIIEREYNGISVVKISERAFKNCTHLQTITIPESVTEIGESAFEGCENLTSIIIPKNIIKIENRLFNDCTKLTTVILPSGIMEIGNSAFGDCVSLSSIELPESVTIIGEQTFWGCTNLKSIIIPDKVTKIGFCAFFNCESLTSIKIPIGVTRIESETFCGCKNLHSITLPDSLIKIGDSAFRNCDSLVTCNLPNSVNEIGYLAFENCSSLYVFAIPERVTKIGFETFSGCKSLKTIIIPTGITEIEWDVFKGCESLTSVTIPKGVSQIYNNTFKDCINLISIVLPDSIKEIGVDSFYNTGYYNDTTNWEDRALYICHHLISVSNEVKGDFTIKPDTLTIGNMAFMECEGLNSVHFPDSLKRIGSGAFLECKNLVSVIIPESVSWIGESAFEGCDNLIIYGKWYSHFARWYASTHNIQFKQI